MPGTRQLLILRHAKSSWDDPGLEDHNRPLSARGQRAARALGDHIRAAGIHPDLVLCSTSRRTRETVDLVDPPGRLLIESGLYDASTHDLLDRLRQVEDEAGSVMVVGHNPAMQSLVLRLAVVPVAGAGVGCGPGVSAAAGTSAAAGASVAVAGTAETEAGTVSDQQDSVEISHAASATAPVLGSGLGGPYEQIVRKFPTGALATLEFEGRWRDLGPGCARLTAFVRPKSLGA